jgi:hypothetical protein
METTTKQLRGLLVGKCPRVESIAFNLETLHYSLEAKHLFRPELERKHTEADQTDSIFHL